VSHSDLLLESREFTSIAMPFNAFCALSKCQTLIHAGTPVRKYDGATFTHVICPSTNYRNFAAHKQPTTGMHFG
jgi:hypothetical protein